MTDTKKKEKPQVKTRPAGKLPSGFANVGSRKPDGSNVADILGLTPPTPSRDSTPSIAPSRDFTRTANSIVREAVPAGAFVGKAKQLYDYLYSQTRGAITPRMSATLSKIKLMAGADIGSEVTLKKNLDRLKAWGLVAERVIAGTHGGNEYTVFLPEEATPSRGSTPSRPSDPLSNLESLESVESSPSTPGLSVDFQRTSDEPKTSLKTREQNIDDEAAPFTGAIEAFTDATKDLTGKAPAAADEHRWRELAEVLVTELKIAAGRTTVSSVPAFLAEHLRRRLWKVGKGEPAPKSDSSPLSASEMAASKNCAECGGTGWHYPNGYEGGVARCRHEKFVSKNEGA